MRSEWVDANRMFVVAGTSSKARLVSVPCGESDAASVTQGAGI